MEEITLIASTSLHTMNSPQPKSFNAIVVALSVILIPIALLLSSCANHNGEAVLRVLNARNAALTRSEDGKGHRLNFVEYTAALRTIDTSGCPQKFLLAWQEYVRVISSKRGFGILSGGPQEITLAESQLEEAASDSGVNFKLPNG